MAASASFLTQLSRPSSLGACAVRAQSPAGVCQFSVTLLCCWVWGAGPASGRTATGGELKDGLRPPPSVRPPLGAGPVCSLCRSPSSDLVIPPQNARRPHCAGLTPEPGGFSSGHLASWSGARRNSHQTPRAAPPAPYSGDSTTAHYDTPARGWPSSSSSPSIHGVLEPCPPARRQEVRGESR